MPSYRFDGKQPSVDAAALIAPSADMIGDVRVGEGASVWFGVVIRADNTPILVGARSNIQDNAMLHSDVGAPLAIGAGVTVGHHAILHGCTIADDVLIGMGAIVLNRAVIPPDCLVAAAALVTEGKTFPAGSLIMGSPAKAVRALSEGERAALRTSAADYCDKAGRFAAGLELCEPERPPA